MVYLGTYLTTSSDLRIPPGHIGIVLTLLFLLFLPLHAQTEITDQTSDQTIIVNDAPEMEVYSFGKDVIIKKEARGVLVFGGNVTIEGRVDGDVAAIGGTVFQTKDAFIGGDVIVFGGTYRPESDHPLRNPDKETVMIAMFEEEIRNLSKNPAYIFSPAVTPSFLAQRLLSVLFWFILSMALTTIAPGAVSRSVARFRISTLKVVGIGVVGFILTTVLVIGSLSLLPNYVSALVLPMAFISLLLAYVFGRVALQLTIGKLIQKWFIAESRHSETVAILLGVLTLTLLLSIPYLWVLGLFALLSSSVGIVLTARSDQRWNNA